MSVNNLLTSSCCCPQSVSFNVSVITNGETSIKTRKVQCDPPAAGQVQDVTGVLRTSLLLLDDLLNICHPACFGHTYGVMKSWCMQLARERGLAT